jgi:hypothetical protein
VVSVCAAKSGPTLALHSQGIQGQHRSAEAVSEARLDLTTLKLQCLSEWEGVQLGGGLGGVHN